MTSSHIQGPADLYKQLVEVKCGIEGGGRRMTASITKKLAKELGIKWSFVEDSVKLLGLEMRRHAKCGYVISLPTPAAASVSASDLILNGYQAKSIFDAMAALNNVGGVLGAVHLDNGTYVMEKSSSGKVYVVAGHRLEEYASQTQFFNAYTGLVNQAR